MEQNKFKPQQPPMSSNNKIANLRQRGIVFVCGDWTNEHAHIAEPLGKAIAKNGNSLMTGGGQGTDVAVCRGFCSVEKRKGSCVGVLWGGMKGYKLPGIYPNKYIEIEEHLSPPKVAIGEHRVTSRNHANDADIVIVLPGGSQTKNEINIMISYEHPIAVSEFWNDVFPSVWSFDTVEDCIALINGVLRDKEKRPEIHKLKVANVLDGKSADELREEEVKRVHEAKADNEEWVAFLVELEAARKKNSVPESS